MSIDGITDSLSIKLLIISMASVLAPILTEQIKRVHVPCIIFEILLGIIIGPHVLDIVQPLPQINMLATIGLTLLMFLAGYEIELQSIKGRPLNLAIMSWFMSLAIALCIAFVLVDENVVLNTTIISLALTTTAFGVLLPTLRYLNQNSVYLFSAQGPSGNLDLFLPFRCY